MKITKIQDSLLNLTQPTDLGIIVCILEGVKSLVQFLCSYDFG